MVLSYTDHFHTCDVVCLTRFHDVKRNISPHRLQRNRKGMRILLINKDLLHIRMMSIDVYTMAWNVCRCEKSESLDVIPMEMRNKDVKDIR